MSIQETQETEIFAQNYPEVAEAPRYSCALGGAYSAALSVFGTVPVLHSGSGCGLGQLFGQHYAGGQNIGGPLGTTSTPCSCLVEEHVIFGGEDKLRELIKSTIELVKGDLFAVISGCVPALIGDDVEAVVREFQSQVPLIHVKTAGFTGNSYLGYELFLDAVVEQFLTSKEKEKGLVNIFGIVPYQHVFYKGDLAVIRNTLEKVGVRANIIFSEFGGVENLRNIPAAELNLVFSPWNGHSTVKKLAEKFDTPYLAFPSVPVGPKQTSHFLRKVGEQLNIASEQVEKVIYEEERKAYRYTEYFGDALTLVLPHAYYGLVTDSGTAIGLTQFLNNEIGYLADVAIITDDPPAEARENIIRELTVGLESAVKPEIIFEVDSHKIREKLKNRSILVLFASSLEKHIAGPEFGALHVSVSFPMLDRLILDRSYAGFRGGLALMEDYISKWVGPL